MAATYQDAEGRVLLTQWEALHHPELRRRIGVTLNCPHCDMQEALGTTVVPGTEDCYPAFITACRGSGEDDCLRWTMDEQDQQSRAPTRSHWRS